MQDASNSACLDRHGLNEIVGREEGCFSSPRFGRGFQARRVWSLISASFGLGLRDQGEGHGIPAAGRPSRQQSPRPGGCSCVS